MKTEYQRKEEAKEKAARELQRTKARLGLGPPGPLKGAIASPLAASPKTRRSKLPPTSDRIPGSAPASDLLHAHKWKRDVEETADTAREMRRKAAQIRPAYNKGAMQYLPRALEKDNWPAREERPPEANLQDRQAGNKRRRRKP
jgi:hypothetical protein